MGFERIERGELQFERQRYRGGFVVALILGVCYHPPSDVAGEGRAFELLHWSVAQLGDNLAKVETI